MKIFNKFAIKLYNSLINHNYKTEEKMKTPVYTTREEIAPIVNKRKNMIRTLSLDEIQDALNFMQELQRTLKVFGNDGTHINIENFAERCNYNMGAGFDTALYNCGYLKRIKIGTCMWWYDHNLTLVDAETVLLEKRRIKKEANDKYRLENSGKKYTITNNKATVEVVETKPEVKFKKIKSYIKPTGTVRVIDLLKLIQIKLMRGDKLYKGLICDEVGVRHDYFKTLEFENFIKKLDDSNYELMHKGFITDEYAIAIQHSHRYFRKNKKSIRFTIDEDPNLVQNVIEPFVFTNEDEGFSTKEFIKRATEGYISTPAVIQEIRSTDSPTPYMIVDGKFDDTDLISPEGDDYEIPMGYFNNEGHFVFTSTIPDFPKVELIEEYKPQQPFESFDIFSENPNIFYSYLLHQYYAGKMPKDLVLKSYQSDLTKINVEIDKYNIEKGLHDAKLKEIDELIVDFNVKLDKTPEVFAQFRGDIIQNYNDLKIPHVEELERLNKIIENYTSIRRFINGYIKFVENPIKVEKF